jgi:hypothetical protein
LENTPQREGNNKYRYRLYDFQNTCSLVGSSVVDWIPIQSDREFFGQCRSESGIIALGPDLDPRLADLPSFSRSSTHLDRMWEKISAVLNRVVDPLLLRLLPFPLWLDWLPAHTYMEYMVIGVKDPKWRCCM